MAFRPPTESRLSRFVLWPVALSLTIVLFLASTACGGDEPLRKVDAATWVHDVCGLAAGYNDAAGRLAADFGGIDVSKPGAKDDLLNLLGDLRAELGIFRKGLQKLGAPNLASGGDVRTAFDSELVAREKEFDQAVTEIRRLGEGPRFEQDVARVLEQVSRKTGLREALLAIAGRARTSDAQDIIVRIDREDACAVVLF
jgi:hypothetical protein